MADLTPYVIQQGDHFASLAAERGFDADIAWKDASHDDLRKKGRTANMLSPGDVVYLPKPKRKFLSVNIGSENQFKAVVPTVTVKLTFMHEGKPLASEACLVHLEDPEPKSMTTDGGGVLTVEAPAKMKIVTVEFPRLGFSRTLGIGHLDPLDSPAGIYQRLANLGHRPFGEEGLSSALSSFQKEAGVPVTGKLDDATKSALESSHGC